MNQAPLAAQLRPRTFDDLVGHRELIAPGQRFRTLIERDRFQALILWGPPGSGKTTIAEIIGATSQRPVVQLSAVSTGVKEIRTYIAESQSLIDAGQKCMLMFMDEIHRLSKNQQDVLLPELERGVIKFIGATTENPSFEVNRAILSRCLTFRLEKLSTDDLCHLLQRTVLRADWPFACRQIADAAIQAIALGSGGDARRALGLLEAVTASLPADATEMSLIDVQALHQENAGFFDKGGENHYDIASALIKSIRASHVDGALHYCARLLEGGEDPEFIVRRLVISASEDIGNANPHMLNFAAAAAANVARVGMPEARIILSQLVCLLARSPKSNRAYLAGEQALEDVRSHPGAKVPMHLRNAPTSLMKAMGYGHGYIYAHDDPTGAARLAYLPDELAGRTYYQPSDSGYEKNLR